ncbi:MAG: hypothetical protein ACJ0OB_04555 [Flavobacteriaceae bacterium]|tara:strand:+ start:1994 stop:2149 length:156 start_codon:yes stop_codon:yes gene_type:complete
MKRVLFFILGSIIGFVFAAFVKSRFHLDWDADMIFPTLLFGGCAVALEKYA